MRLLLTTFLACLITLLGSPLAAAHHPGMPLNDPLTERYINEAYAFFKQPRGCSHAVLGVPTDREYAPNGAAWAEQPGCSIWVSEPAFPVDPNRQQQAVYCGLIRHEVGHNIGLGHTGGANVMNPDGWVHPNCYPPYHVLHRHRHIHRHRHENGRIHKHRHFHKHYHLKVGQP